MKEYQIVKVITVELGNAPKIEVFTQVVVELKIVFKHVLLFRESFLNIQEHKQLFWCVCGTKTKLFHSV